MSGKLLKLSRRPLAQIIQGPIPPQIQNERGNVIDARTWWPTSAKARLECAPSLEDGLLVPTRVAKYVDIPPEANLTDKYSLSQAARPVVWTGTRIAIGPVDARKALRAKRNYGKK
jgi:hypothetical protein